MICPKSVAHEPTGTTKLVFFLLFTLASMITYDIRAPLLAISVVITFWYGNCFFNPFRSLDIANACAAQSAQAFVALMLLISDGFHFYQHFGETSGDDNAILM